MITIPLIQHLQQRVNISSESNTLDLENIVFLVWDGGQSNAVGRAETNRQIQLTKYPEIPSLTKIYYKPDYSSSDNGAFQVLHNGSINTKEPDQSGSLEMFGAYSILGQLLSGLVNRTTYIVMAGDGGTALKQNLTSPDWAPASTNECFQIFTEYYYSVAYDKVAAENPGKTIVPIIVWHQGETDAMDNTATSQYAANFSSFVTALRASHSSLGNALMLITKLYYNLTANEDTINDVFQAYADANSDIVKIIDISDQPRKVDLTTEQKGGLSPTASDDNHTSYLGQIAKGERIYAQIKEFYNIDVDDSEITTYTTFDPTTIGTSGIRLQLSRDKLTIGTNSSVSAAANDFNIGTFNSVSGSPAIKFKVDQRKGWISFLAASSARLNASAPIGTSLFADETGVSYATWVKPRDGQPGSTFTLINDIQNVNSANNSRLSVLITTAGKINAFVAVSGSIGQALTQNAIFTNGQQLEPKHIAVVFDNVAHLISIYVDGVLQTLDAVLNGDITAVNMANYVNASTALTIGATRSTLPFGSYFNGLMRETYVFKGVLLSQSQIENLMLN